MLTGLSSVNALTKVGNWSTPAPSTRSETFGSQHEMPNGSSRNETNGVHRSYIICFDGLVAMDTAALTQSAVERHIREEVGNLQDESRKAHAMAGLCILLTQLQEPSVPDELLSAIPNFFALLDKADDTADRNLQVPNNCGFLWT